LATQASLFVVLTGDLRLHHAVPRISSLRLSFHFNHGGL